MAGRHVAVTGGGSGIGAEIAAHIAALGATVSVLGRRPAPLEAVAARIGARAYPCDVTQPDSVEAAVAQARTDSGPVTVAIANAGAATSKPFAETRMGDLQAMLDVNLGGVFNLWQACHADMLSGGWGRMIAIASSAGLKGYPYVTGYCAAKHAVVGLVRALSAELARTGITVNAVCPGFVDTPMLARSVENIVDKTGATEEQALRQLRSLNPMQRFVQVGEVASAAAWLASPASGAVNGQAVAVDGGET